MGGNYQKDIFRQLTELMEKVDSLQQEHKEERQEIKVLKADVRSLSHENNILKEQVTSLKKENHKLLTQNSALKEENLLLRNDTERMKRILNNDSSNSSLPPSSDKSGKGKSGSSGKPANTYNGRTKSGKKPGGQPGHKGTCLSKKDVEDKIKSGKLNHRIKHIGSRGKQYITRYQLDFDIRAVATEYRIYPDKNGKYHIPAALRTDVTYGDTLKALCAYLYSEGVVSTERIADLVNSLADGAFTVSEGSVYNFSQKFSENCRKLLPSIEEDLLNEEVLCTDATTITVNGKKKFIRNFSSKNSVMYFFMDKKSLKALRKIHLLTAFSGILEHDHETALYHFGIDHGECNIHLGRYLLKNTQETGNTWSRDMRSFLNGMNEERKRLIAAGCEGFSETALDRYEARYEEILLKGKKEHETTSGLYATGEERKLLNRLRKYKKNHLLFLYDFRVPYSDNMSERDLRKCKNREKMAGGFRKTSGAEMYCTIMSVLETLKRRGKNLLHSIAAIIADKPVIL